jgi:hypothetical protein
MANADISPESAPAVTRAMTSRVHLSSLCALRGPPLTEANPVLTKRFDEDALATMNMVGLSFAFPRRTLSEFAKAQTWAELDRLKDEEDCDGGGGRLAADLGAVLDALRRHGTVSEHTDEDGATIVQHSGTGLVGFASKKLSAPYRPDGHATG